MTTSSSQVISLPRLHTITIPLNKIGVEKVEAEDGKNYYTASVEGERFAISRRFKASVMGILGQGMSILDLYGFDEVVDRFQQVKPKKPKNVKLTLDLDYKLALGAVSPGRFLPDMEQTLEIIRSLDGTARYSEGELIAFCKPHMETNFKVMNDEHQVRNAFTIPLDGYGTPLHHVGMLRQVCSNGLVAWGKVWSTICTYGKKTDPMWAMDRFMKLTANVEAETRIRERLDVAANTIASLEDVHKLVTCFSGVESFDTGMFLETVLDSNLSVTHADMEQYAAKERQKIASMVTVYDLINMATEGFTHYGVNDANKFIGKVLGENFDLEGVNETDDEIAQRVAGARNYNPAFWLGQCLVPTGNGMGTIPEFDTANIRTFSRHRSMDTISALMQEIENEEEGDDELVLPG